MNSTNNKGYVLVNVVIVLAVLSILAFSLLNVSSAETNFATRQTKKTQAHYVGRAGIQVGLKVIEKEMAVTSFTTVGDFVNTLNTYMNTIPLADLNLGSAGSFKLSFEPFESDSIKIISEGSTTGSTPARAVVTYIAKLETSINLSINPTEWVNGINLTKGLHTGSYLGKGVKLKGKPVQSPTGSGSGTFQASVIKFSDYPKDGISFLQIKNSIPILFDAEVIYFESGVVLNNSGDLVALGISDSVINYRMTNSGVLPMYNVVHSGFENQGRYENFLGAYTENKFSTYSFNIGKHYGLVRFGGDIRQTTVGKSSVKLMDAGYYFYENGVDIRNPGTKQLIPINPNDGIIKALENQFNSHISSSGYIWNDK